MEFENKVQLSESYLVSIGGFSAYCALALFILLFLFNGDNNNNNNFI